MSAVEKGQQEQQGSSAKSFDASAALGDLVPKDSLQKVGGAALQRKGGGEAKLNEQKSNQSGVLRWLQLLAAVGIPLLLAYLAFAGLVNPQFAELRDLISSNRDLISVNREAIAANSSSIERLEAKIDSSIERLDTKIDSSVARLDGKIDLIAELLILASTNENITEAELRNILNAGEE